MHIQTRCDDCVFAKFKGITQVGCELDRIDKLKNNGIEVIEGYNEEKEFYVLNNYFCNTARTKKWLDNLSPVIDPIEKVYKEAEATFTVLFVIDGADIKSVENTIKLISEQTLKPKLTVPILNKPGIPPSHLIQLLNKYKLLAYKLEMSAGEGESKEEALLRQLFKCKTQYSTIVETDKYFPSTVLEYINNLANYDMKRFVLIGNKNNQFLHCLTVQNTTLQITKNKCYDDNGLNWLSSTVQLIEEIKNWSENEKMEELIKIWSEDYNYIEE